jgi:hypothetical protein
MQSTGQLDLQVPQAMQASVILLGIDNPPSGQWLNFLFIVLGKTKFVNDFFPFGGENRHNFELRLCEDKKTQ